ncbi:MAG: YdbH domain-containing protein [Caulobacteraceae bacterium]|nr:YdbH domain-containing protein [Caulobacteraceae bacterium]
MNSPAQNPAKARRRWATRVLAGGALLSIVLFGALYLGRRPIAERLADGWLQQHRLPGEFEVRSIGLSGLTASLRLGPKDDPDLQVERLQVDYGLDGPWSGRGLAVATRAVRLFRPQLKARFADGRLDLGSLTSLLQALSGRAGKPGPSPDLTVEAGLLRLATPGGALTITGDGAMTAGALARARVRLAPFALRLGTARLAGAAQTLGIERRGARLQGSAQGGPLMLAWQGQAWRSGGQTLSADLPAPGREGRMGGPARMTIQIRGASGEASGAALAEGADLAMTIAGTLNADGAGAALEGAAGQGVATVRTLRRGDVVIGEAAVRFAIDEGRWAAGRFGARLRGSASGRGRMDAAAAHRAAAGLPPLSAAPAYRTAAEKALRAFQVSVGGVSASVSNGDLRLGLTAPLTLDSGSGARLTIAGLAADVQGAAARGAGGRLTLAGGGLPQVSVQLTRWSLASAALAADLALGARLDLPIAEGLDVQGRGRLGVAAGALRFELADCATVTARRLPIEDNPVVGLAARVCPAGGPLAQASGGGWRAAGRIEAARAAAPKLAMSLADGAGAFAAAGSGGAPGAVRLDVAKARLLDAGGGRRFNPLIAAGALALERGIWTGDIAAATAAGRRIGTVRLRHDTAAGVGRADIDAHGLAFAPDGLQPSELTPLAAFVKDASGPLAFSGWFAWGPGRPMTSGGEVVARNLTFKSPTGKVLALDTHLRLASLAPLASARGQRVTVREIETAIPLTQLAATAEFDADAVAVEAASAGFAGGRLRLEPMTAPFAPGSAYRGVLILEHVDLGQIVAASNLSHMMSLQAVVDGRIPFQIDPAGVRIVSGHLAAAGPGRISISRTALGGVAASQVTAKGTPAQGEAGGLAQNLAYDAMEDLSFDTLEASLDSVAGERLRILFHIKGRHDPPKPVRAQIALGDLIAGKAFSKPIPLPSGTPINLTLDSSLNFGELVRSLEQAWRDSLAPSRSAAVQDEAAQMSAPMETTRP